MEKLMYAFTQADVGARTPQLVEELGPALKALPGTHGVQVNICDERFSGALLMPIHRTQPPIAGTIGIWLDSSFHRQAVEQLISQHVDGFSGYSVVESQPLVNSTVPVQSGQRLPALSHVVFLEKPPALAYPDWLDIWLNSHTRVAIDTQSTFQYVQNIVLRTLTPDAPGCHAIVEECFPEAACGDQAVFYDAVGDAEELRSRQQRMMDSVSRFVDFERMDLLLTSQYVI